jgi:ribonucleoside-diphosphate reductase alpha chain
VLAPFSKHPRVDWTKLRMLTGVAIRFLDDVYDISAYPFKTLSSAAHEARRLGLGVTGLHSMFNMLGLDYGSQSSLDLTNQLMQLIRDTAYQASIEIAREKGPFPVFDRVKHAASPMVLNLPHELQDAIANHGIRNSHLLAVAYDPRLDRLAHDVSHGIEPLAALTSPAPSAAKHLATALQASAEAQLAIAAAVQFHVANSVAVHIHVPASTSSAELGSILRRAWQLKLKNCRVARAVHCASGLDL